MGRICVLMCLAVCGLTASVNAQELLTQSLRFVEVTTGTNVPVSNPDGFLEPGESARIEVSIAFSPAVGTVVHFPPPPEPGFGTIAGFETWIFNLYTTVPQAGSWNFLSRRTGWALGTVGSPTNSSTVTNIQIGQLPSPGSTANPMNPIDAIWSGVFTPSSYSARMVTFYGADNEPGRPLLWVEYARDPNGAPLYIPYAVPSQYNELRIPIVPAPGEAGVLTLAGLWASRRRRPARVF